MTSTKPHDGACACGGLRISLTGPPALVSSCHCLACQRRTGALFGSSAFFPRDQIVSIAGDERTFQRQGDSGGTLTFHFCPTCGSTVYWDNPQVPHLVCVAVGAFADPSFQAPARTIWTETKHGWLDFPADTPSYPRAAG
ncbi:GFA family protein [Phenylobacterium sp.]|uniref:GFA family protein n=1 Tax=Phenylobacterium sp. TaxID=1871053 RepID=UPI002736E94B|nr:GFA family protein [Phenylobacterium sp.]MDP3852962.1 GFA family protein [Phenylobacterium sp.]